MTPKTAILKRVVIKTLLCAAIGLILALVGQKVVFADYITGQNEFNYSWTLPVGHLIRQTLGNSFTDQILNSIEVKADTNYPNPKIWIRKNGNWIADWPLTASSTNFLTFSSSTPLTLTTGDDFDFYLIDFAGTGEVVIYGSNDPNSYPNGVCGTSYPGGGEPTNPCGSVADIYFLLNANVNSVALNFPVNNATTTNFTGWETTGYSLTNWQHLTILCGSNANDLTTCGQELVGIGGFSKITPNFQTFTAGTYYAQAELSYDLPGPLTEPPVIITTATSTKISFEIVAGSTYQNFPTWYPTSTASSTQWVLTCDPNAAEWAQSICHFLVYLFSPNQGDFNQFLNLKDALSTKPPIGYFYVIKNALNFSSTSSPAFTLENASSTLADPIYNPLRNGITFILWLLFAFWVFNRIRNIAL